MKSVEHSSKGLGLVPLTKFLNELGVSSATGWRFRKRRWLSTVIISGRHYVTSDEIAKFQSRALQGDFSKAKQLTSHSSQVIPINGHNSAKILPI